MDDLVKYMYVCDYEDGNVLCGINDSNSFITCDTYGPCERRDFCCSTGHVEWLHSIYANSVSRSVVGKAKHYDCNNIPLRMI